MIIKIPYNADIKTSKNIIYKIVNNNQTITSIPKKMKRQIDNVDLTYRIYFSKLEPIIYTKVVDDHIELYLRFLIHPKKIRNVEDMKGNSFTDKVYSLFTIHYSPFTY